MYVIRSQTANNLLGRDTACAMKPVKCIEEVHDAFGEYRTLRTESVTIQLKNNAEPYDVHRAQRVPLPLVQRVKEEIQSMEENGIIKRVTEPTDWCASMVPVAIRICVTLKG